MPVKIDKAVGIGKVMDVCKSEGKIYIIDSLTASTMKRRSDV